MAVLGRFHCCQVLLSVWTRMVHCHCPLISEDLMMSLVVVQVYPDSITLIFTCECSLHQGTIGGGGCAASNGIHRGEKTHCGSSLDLVVIRLHMQDQCFGHVYMMLLPLFPPPPIGSKCSLLLSARSVSLLQLVYEFSLLCLAPSVSVFFAGHDCSLLCWA